MKKRKREYTNLRKASDTVNNLAMAIMAILIIGGVVVSIGVAGVASSDDKTIAFIGAFLPFVAHTVIVYAASFVIRSILEHLMRMEIIALDGSDAFESETERDTRIKEAKKKQEEDWKKF